MDEQDRHKMKFQRRALLTFGVPLLCLVVVGFLALAFAPENQPVLLQLPGGQSSSRPSPLIRVNLTSSGAQSVQLTIEGNYTISPIGSRRELESGNGLPKTTVKPTELGFQIGRNEFPTTRLEIRCSGPHGIWVNGHQYRGKLHLFRRPDKKLLAVNVLPLEEYLASVVDSEMPASFSHAARKAQAIVARTYALYQMQHSRKHPHFDLYASTRSQKYLGTKYRNSQQRLLAGESSGSRSIIDETRGVVCTYQGKIFCTYYSAVCGGRTVAGQEVFSDAAPPVQSVPCTWCQPSRLYRWKINAKKMEVVNELNRFLGVRKKSQLGPNVRIQMLQSPEGHIPRFKLTDGPLSEILTGKEVRRAVTSVKLHSPIFAIREAGANILFDGRGHGHGVGFCQWGASGQGQVGKSALQILQHYYPGSRVVLLAF